MAEKKKVTVNLNVTLFNDLNSMADATGCPATSIIRVALLEFLNKEKKGG